MTVVSVIYPKSAGSEFNLGYYTQTHIPLVKSLWNSMGLKKFELLHGKAALDGSHPGLEIIALLTFESREHVRAAVEKFGDQVMADIPQFTNIRPILQVNETVEN